MLCYYNLNKSEIIFIIILENKVGNIEKKVDWVGFKFFWNIKW